MTISRTLALVGGTAFLLAAVAEGKALKWHVDDGSPSWTPARETFAVSPNDVLGTAPMPTHAPEAWKAEQGLELLKKREQGSDTCGYASGDLASELTCAFGSSCVVNERSSAVGCCLGALGDCAIATACYSMGDTDILDVASSDLSFVGYCSDPRSEMTECLTYTYTGGFFEGYRGYACWTEATLIEVLYEATKTGTTTTDKDKETQEPLEPVVPPTAPPTAVPGTGDDDDDNGGGGPFIKKDKKVNAGAIAGGVIGGLAFLAVVGFAVIFLLKKKKKQQQKGPNPGPNPGAAAGMYANGPPQQQPPQMMQQQPQMMQPQQPQMYQPQPVHPPMQAIPPPGSPPPPSYMGAMGNDNNNQQQGGYAQQMNDPKMGLHQSFYAPSTVSPPGSPPQQQQQQQMDTISSAVSPQGTGQQQQQQVWGGPPSPLGAGGQADGMGGMYAQAQQPVQTQQQAQTQTQAHTQTHTQYHHNPSGAVEMPTNRGDGDLRELA